MTQPPANSDPPPPCRILALEMLTSVGLDLPDGVLATAGFGELDAGLLDRIKPDHVLLPLVSAGHDATAVVERLQALGYAGLITVVALRLPNSGMVEAELRALGPGARLTLLTP